MDTLLRTSLDSDRVMTVWMDVPGKPVNTCSMLMLDELDALLQQIEKDAPAAVIFASAKPRSFSAGADLVEVGKMSGEELAVYLAKGQSVFSRIARLAMPTVAAINGDCLGGGFEMALACQLRVAADDPSISIGLPEVKLGLIPAWGGSTRLPRLIGLRRALGILLAGKTMPPRKALKSGLVDEVVRPEAMLAAAGRLLREGPRKRKLPLTDRVIGKTSMLRRRAFDAARRQTLEKTFGNYPALIRLLDVLEAGYAGGVEAGLRAEQETIAALIEGAECQNLLRVFFLRQGAKKRLAKQLPAAPHDVHHAAVIGGGTMGSGIVHALIRSGVQVRLIEVSPQSVSAALGRIRKMLDQDVADGRLDKLAARHAMNRVSPTTQWTGLRVADLVIEAAFENLDAKKQVFARLDSLCRPDAVLATNTSSLRVTDIASAVSNPSRVVGLHFFNPVPKMPLVEVVRSPLSGDEALSTAAALAGRIGKIPILVGDAPGFLVNRLLIPYLNEAVQVAMEGMPVETVDLAMKRWGMPMGPFELLDEIGLDVAALVLRGGADSVTQLPPALNEAVARGWLGKKSGRGFYIYPATTRRSRYSNPPAINAELSSMLGERQSVQNPSSAQDDIQWRLVLPMINQAAGALREGVVDSAETIDLAMVMGAGVAPFRGGLTRFADQVEIADIVARLDELTGRYGPRFAPDSLLRDLAATASTFSQFQAAPKFVSPTGVTSHAHLQAH